MKVYKVLVLSALVYTERHLLGLVYTVLVLNDSGDVANFCPRFS